MSKANLAVALMQVAGLILNTISEKLWFIVIARFYREGFTNPVSFKVFFHVNVDALKHSAIALPLNTQR